MSKILEFYSRLAPEVAVKVPVFKRLSDVEDHQKRNCDGQTKTGFVSLGFDEEGVIRERNFHIVGHTEDPITVEPEVLFGRSFLPADHQVRECIFTRNKLFIQGLMLFRLKLCDPGLRRWQINTC